MELRRALPLAVGDVVNGRRIRRILDGKRRERKVEAACVLCGYIYVGRAAHLRESRKPCECVRAAQAIERARTGAEMRLARHARGLRLETVAEAVGVSIKVLSDRERGEKTISAETEERVREVLGMTVVAA